VRVVALDFHGPCVARPTILTPPAAVPKIPVTAPKTQINTNVNKSHKYLIVVFDLVDLDDFSRHALPTVGGMGAI
jgi:hypothetical protein